MSPTTPGSPPCEAAAPGRLSSSRPAPRPSESTIQGSRAWIAPARHRCPTPPTPPRRLPAPRAAPKYSTYPDGVT